MSTCANHNQYKQDMTATEAIVMVALASILVMFHFARGGEVERTLGLDLRNDPQNDIPLTVSDVTCERNSSGKQWACDVEFLDQLDLPPQHVVFPMTGQHFPSSFEFSHMNVGMLGSTWYRVGIQTNFDGSSMSSNDAAQSLLRVVRAAMQIGITQTGGRYEQQYQSYSNRESYSNKP